jgi:tetratricopeptide (TPR) repeat protein
MMPRAATRLPFLLLFFALLSGAQTGPAQQSGAEKPEVVSLLGNKYFAQKDEKGVVAAAREKLKADPRNIDNLIALGLAQASVWRYHDAIDTYTRGIELAPQNAMLYRHRGHRYISTRQFRKATADLEKAAQLNAKDFDIWYHLGLSYYLQGDFKRAIPAYENCLAVVDEQMKKDPAQSDDSLASIADWLYMTYRRAGQTDQAARLLERIRPGMKVKENSDYYNRLLMYKGLKKEAELLNMDNATPLQMATLGYGVANWNLYNGRKEPAAEIFRKITAGDYWPAFGFIAAEAELARARR